MDEVLGAASFPPPNGLPSLDDDPFSAENLREPFPFQARLREAGSLVWLSRYGIYAVGRWQEAAQALADWRTFSSARGVGISDFKKEKPWRDPAVLLETDPPRHNEIRARVNRILSQRAVESLRNDFTRQADELLDRVLPMTEFDMQTLIAEAYPLKVFGDAIGISETNRNLLLSYGDMAFNNFGPMNEVRSRSNEAGEQVGVVDWIMAQTQPDAVRPGSLGEQFHKLADDGLITRYEAWNVMRGQLTAGVDTTIAAIGHFLLCLAQDPEQYALLRRSPELVRNGFDEAIRHLSPLQAIFRTTMQDSILGETRINSDEKLLISIGAANRDPRKWIDPDRFDLQRITTDHLGFGRGIHVCAGMNVARLEAECLLSSFIKRVNQIELAEEPQYSLNNTVRRLSKLVVRVF